MRILFGVFDWGLGHATRDIPLIEELLRKNKVDVISTGRALKLLKSRFGKKCRYFDVRSVHFPYPKGSLFVAKFILHLPKMLLKLAKARKISKRIINKGKYDKIISDCRYDVYDKLENSFLINHQLKFKTPVFKFIAMFLLSRVMAKYGKMIVPDFPERNLTKDLTENKLYRGKVEYIGILSQLNKRNVKEDIDYFISVSGPEPQRTIFERKIFEQINSFKGRIVITCGKPECSLIKKKNNVKYYDFLSQKKQEEIMNRAKFIISRPGYTTVMELIELEKKNVLFVPTPGMTEQEYIADLYEKSRYFYHVSQDKMNLGKDIKVKKGFNGYTPLWKTKESIKRFMENIN